MAESPWLREGPTFTIERGGRVWTLAPGGRPPGLFGEGEGEPARLLALESLATAARRDEGAFDGSTLIEVELHRRRVQATYAPPGWDGLQVRAAWEPTRDGDGFDLEVQLTAATADVLRGVELAVISRPAGLAGYVELVAPNDRVEGTPELVLGGSSTRQVLFGHDLEKGVVLRGRIRGIWVHDVDRDEAIRRRFQAFVSEPPPLGP